MTVLDTYQIGIKPKKTTSCRFISVAKLSLNILKPVAEWSGLKYPRKKFWSLSSPIPVMVVGAAIVVFVVGETYWSSKTDAARTSGRIGGEYDTLLL